jgi:hypothetical protein
MGNNCLADAKQLGSLASFASEALAAEVRAQTSVYATKVLLLRVLFAQAAHALLQLFAQACWGVGIEGDQVPQRLGAVAA